MTRIFTCGPDLKNDLPSAYQKLQNNFLNAVYQILNSIPEIDNWIVATDGGSWRKEVEVPKCVSVTYKGNRVQDDSYNWKRIWETWDLFKQTLRDQGVTVAHGTGVEGDDWCAYWAGKLRKQGTCSLIWTKDHDLMQLVKETDGAWTGWYNETDGLYLNSSQEPLNQFFTPVTSSGTLLDTLRKRIKQVTYIDPVKEILIEKVFNGDVADNIKPVLYHTKNTRTYKLPKKEIPYDLDLFNETEVDNFLEEKLKQPKYSDLTFEDVKEHFEYNKTLVILNSVFYPEQIKDVIKENGQNYTMAPELVQACHVDSIMETTKTSFDEIIDLL